MEVEQHIISQYMAVSVPNVSDAFDRLDIQGTTSGILPLYPCQKIVGPAATLKLVPDGEAEEPTWSGTLRAITKGGRGSVLVIDASENPHVNAYGGVAGATSKHYGYVGCVTDAVMRDVDEYKGIEMPVYARGISQTSVRGRSSCAGYDIEVKLGGIRVRPGDLIMADENGTVVIPREQMTAVLEFAQKVKAAEERVIAEIRRGVDPVQAHENVHYGTMLKKTTTA